MFESENLEFVREALQNFEYVNVDDLPEELKGPAMQIHMVLMNFHEKLEESEAE